MAVPAPLSLDLRLRIGLCADALWRLARQGATEAA